MNTFIAGIQNKVIRRSETPMRLAIGYYKPVLMSREPGRYFFHWRQIDSTSDKKQGLDDFFSPPDRTAAKLMMNN